MMRLTSFITCGPRSSGVLPFRTMIRSSDGVRKMYWPV